LLFIDLKFLLNCYLTFKKGLQACRILFHLQKAKYLLCYFVLFFNLCCISKFCFGQVGSFVFINIEIYSKGLDLWTFTNNYFDYNTIYCPDYKFPVLWFSALNLKVDIMTFFFLGKHLEKFRMANYNEYMFRNPLIQSNLNLKFIFVASYNFNESIFSRSERLTFLYIKALSQKNYFIFAVKMLFTSLIINVNLNYYCIGLTNRYIMSLRNLFDLKAQFAPLMLWMSESCFVLNLNWYVNKIMCAYNKRLFFTARWFHYDIYSIYANLFRVHLDVTNMSLRISELFEKKIINLVVKANEFIHFYWFIDLLTMNFPTADLLKKQSLFFYEILEVVFCEYFWKKFANFSFTTDLSKFDSVKRNWVSFFCRKIFKFFSVNLNDIFQPSGLDYLLWRLFYRNTEILVFNTESIKVKSAYDDIIFFRYYSNFRVIKLDFLRNLYGKFSGMVDLKFIIQFLNIEDLTLSLLNSNFEFNMLLFLLFKKIEFQQPFYSVSRIFENYKIFKGVKYY
jgi:hypothetical protein